MPHRHGKEWDELRLSEDPAVEVLSKHLGYAYVAPEVLEAERASLYETVLVGRLGKASQAEAILLLGGRSNFGLVGGSVATTVASTSRRGQLDGVLLRPAHASAGSLVASSGGEHRD